MQTLRYLIRLILTFANRFKGILLIGIALGVAFFFTINLVFPILQKKTERIGITGRHHTDNLPPFFLNMLSDGLTQIDSSGNVEPNLAALWETPDKGKSWIFTIKENAKWQDGDPVTSDSIVYEFSDVVIERPDEKTIIFRLKEPFSPFPSVVSTPTFKRGLLGTGEWSVKNVSISGNFVQKLEILDSQGNKKIFRFYPTETATKLAFKLGEVDKIINMFDSSPFSSWEQAEVQTHSNENQVVTLFFNTKDSLLSDKTARQALIYSIDKNIDGSVRAVSPISPNSWAYNSQVKDYTYDKGRAEEIIEELPEELLDKLPIKLVTVPHLLTLAEHIESKWEEVGIETIVQVSSIIPSEFQVFLAVFDIPKDPDQYFVWHSTQIGTNISGYSDQRVDKLLEDGRSEIDIEARRKIYLDFQRFLLEDAPAAFLSHPTYYTIIRK